jgi:C4-dicarboxylate-specific signal transduction histidine kinase
VEKRTAQEVIEKVSRIAPLLGYKAVEANSNLDAQSKEVQSDLQTQNSINLMRELKKSLGVQNCEQHSVLDFILGIEIGIFIFDQQNQLVFANSYGHELVEKIGQVHEKLHWTQFCWRWFKAMELVTDPFQLSNKNRSKQLSIKEWGDRVFQVNQIHIDTGNNAHQGTLVLIYSLSINDEDFFKAISKKTDLFGEVIKFEKVEQQLKESQQALVETEKLSSIGVMAGQIAHEILNPVSIAALKLENLKNALKNNNMTVAMEAIAKMETMITRITKIVKSLRGMARKDDEDPFIYCSFREIIDDTLTICAEQARNKRIKLSAEGVFDVRLPCRAGQLVQVILNLIRNSIDEIESKPDSWIKIEGQLFEAENVKFIEVVVCDSGLGIPDEVVRKLMTPFFTTKKAGKGTGIGLNLSRKICQDHKGTLEYRLHKGHTAFVITLPL